MSLNPNHNKLTEFQQLLLKFNEKHNLVSRLKATNLTEDIEDCQELINHIPTNTNRILDLGSGNGFPGIIIAITRPSLVIDLAEKQTKKAHFLKTTINRLGLKNARVIQKNIANNTDESYDLIVARAVATTEKILQMTNKITLPNSKYLLMKGMLHKTQDELKNLTLRHKIHPYTLHEKERCIVEVFSE